MNNYKRENLRKVEVYNRILKEEQLGYLLEIKSQDGCIKYILEICETKHIVEIILNSNVVIKFID